MEFVFEFGETAQSHAYLERFPNLPQAFERLVSLSNKVFGRPANFKSRMEDVVFSLGHTCREDLLEVVFLAVNGYDSGAMKLVRGLYERALTVCYIAKNPDQAERFGRFAGIQEKKLLDAALKIVTEEVFDKQMGEENTAAKIRERYEAVKPEFQVTVCKTCKRKSTSISWGIDIPSMVQKVGAPFDQVFLTGYAIPNLSVHATLASALNRTADEPESMSHDDEVAIFTAIVVFFSLLRVQNSVFELGLEEEISACENELIPVLIGAENQQA